MGIKVFYRSLTTAFGGLVYVVRSEQNARIHLLSAIAALLAGVIFDLSNAEMAAIFFAILIVFVAEIINTAVENILDLIEPNDNPKVRMVKDIAAGAVLVSAIGAFAIGVAIFTPHLTGFTWHL